MNRKRILRYIRNLIIFFFASTILSVVALRFIPVYITPLMVIRSVEQLTKGEKVVMKHKWVPKEEISRHLPMAVIASEDNRFASHNGFDFKEISRAIEENKKRKKPEEQVPSASRQPKMYSYGPPLPGSEKDSKSISRY